jgi:hypothetical protein
MVDSPNSDRHGLPSSLIPQSTETLRPVVSGLDLIRQATLIDLAGIALDPTKLDDKRKEQYAQLAALIAQFIESGGSILRDIVSSNAWIWADWSS